MIPRPFAWESRKIGLIAAVTPRGCFDSHGRPLRMTQAVNQGSATVTGFPANRDTPASSPYAGANLADQYRELLQAGTALTALTWTYSTSTNNSTFRNYVSADDHGASQTGFVVRYNYNTGTIQYVSQQGAGTAGAAELPRGIALTNMPNTQASEHVFLGTVTSFNVGYVVEAYLNQHYPKASAPTTLSSAASTSSNYFPSSGRPIQLGLSNPSGATTPRSGRSRLFIVELWRRYVSSSEAFGRVRHPMALYR